MLYIRRPLATAWGGAQRSNYQQQVSRNFAAMVSMVFRCGELGGYNLKLIWQRQPQAEGLVCLFRITRSTLPFSGDLITLSVYLCCSGPQLSYNTNPVQTCAANTNSSAWQPRTPPTRKASPVCEALQYILYMQMIVSKVVDQNYLSRKRPFSTKQQCCICVCSRNCSNSTFRTKPCIGILSLSHCLLDSQRLFPDKYVDMRVHHRIPNHCIRKDCCVVGLYCKAYYCVIPFKMPD